MNRKYTTTPPTPTTQYPHELWENYTLFLVKQGINKKHVAWYVYRTQHYIAAFPDHYIRDHTPQQVEHYFTQLGQDASLATWQFRQAIDAIRILFRSALKISWAQQMDWNYWHMAAKELEVQHVTVARDYTDALADLVEPLASEERCSVELQQRYQPDLAAVVRVIRLKNYAMRTEKTYRSWIARFFYFHKSVFCKHYMANIN